MNLLLILVIVLGYFGFGYSTMKAVAHWLPEFSEEDYEVGFNFLFWPVVWFGTVTCVGAMGLILLVNALGKLLKNSGL